MKRWYAIQTYAGSELKVKEELEKRVRELDLGRKVQGFKLNGDEAHFLAPVEEVITSKSRTGRSAEYRIPYEYELQVEPNQRINRSDLLAVKPERRVPYDAKVEGIETLQRVIIELTNRNEEVYKLPDDKRIRRDIRVGEKVPANVPLTSDRDPQFFTKVKGKVVDRSRIRRVTFDRRDEAGEPIVEEMPNRYLVKLKEGQTLRQGDLLEKEDRIHSRTSGMTKIKEYKDKRVLTVQRIEKRRLFPGYVFGKLDLDEETKGLVEGLKARFVGNPPLPLPEDEMKVVKRKAGLMEMPEREGPVIEVDFEDGEVVEIVEGPFADFTGEITDIDKENEEVTVMVKIFGRETPVRLGFEGIEKL